MISLKKYLEAGRSEELASAYARVTHLLLEAIRLHSVEADPEDLARFRAEIAELDRRLEAASNPAELLVVAGQVIKAFEAYNHRVGRALRAQVLELREMVQVLGHGLERLAAGSERSVAALKDITRQVERACAIEDIRLLRTKLADCVRELEQEAVRHREESALLISRLRAEVAKVGSRSGREARFDPVTGLPGRPEAERAITAACREGRHAWVAIFVIDRLALVNNRFGYAAGDQILRSFVVRLRRFLHAVEPVFRWSGPAFVALIERDAPEGVVEREVRHFAAQRHEEFLEADGRSGLVPVSVSWLLLPVFRFDSAEAIFIKLDRVVASQAEPAAAKRE